MPNLKEILKVSQEQMDTLIKGGEVKGETLDKDTLYAVPTGDETAGLFPIPYDLTSTEALKANDYEAAKFIIEHIEDIKKGAYIKSGYVNVLINDVMTPPSMVQIALDFYWGDLSPNWNEIIYYSVFIMPSALANSGVFVSKIKRPTGAKGIMVGYTTDGNVVEKDKNTEISATTADKFLSNDGTNFVWKDAPTLYVHAISVGGYEEYGWEYHFVIINNTAKPMTLTDVGQFFQDNGFTTRYNSYPASGLNVILEGYDNPFLYTTGVYGDAYGGYGDLFFQHFDSSDFDVIDTTLLKDTVIIVK